MRNRKIAAIVAIGALMAGSAAALAYAPLGNVSASGASGPVLHWTANKTYAPSHVDVLHPRLAQSCIAHGQTCVINGTPCCNSTDSCKGTFPNTYCQ